MAFFKFRKGGDEQPTPPTASESVEAMRKRARHRLVGAAVLVLIGVVGFPLLFDSQPRPMAVDIPIEIPDKGKVRPLGAPVIPAATQSSGVVIEEREEPAAPVASTPVPKATETKAAVAKPEPKPEPTAETKPEPKPEPKAEPKPAAKPAEKVADKPADKAAAEAAKAQALLDGKAPSDVKATDKPSDKKPAADTGRFVVQVGAYNESAKLQEARSKVEKAGFKTYTQVVGAKESQRTRVRIGPFASKADAQKAADKLKKLNLPAAILEL
ncbi:MAG: SPOR domain-containing protein [Rhodoferax sp.]|uniref:SPOR domain-containing protein n=1 Tax=Rhodoferax sp. TaxID=50421 RepID=UPI002ACE0311|nr:SPOR domain-containing protein [Rhodoferax sp.]MDZ7893098.1 SPOR domain-containing protein [Rhodoferax sp.]